MDILFSDSGSEALKYYEDDAEHHYSYTINTFEYPTVHGHVDYWEFCIVTEGTLKHFVGGQPTVLCPAKSMCITTTKERHAILKATQNVRYVNISVRESHLLGILNAVSPTFKERILQGERVFPVSDTLLSEVESLLHQCNLLGAEDVDRKNGLLCSAVLLILQELNRIHLNVPAQLSTFMKRLLAAKEKREFVSYTTADLQRALGYSPAHLNRLFKEHFALTPYEYLQKCKFRYARNLLQSTDITMQKIAYEIGYSNLSHFFKNFRKYYGVTPGEYRKNAQASVISK